jgi:hypothetical protein
MNINLFLYIEIILVLLAIFISNGIIYSLTFFNLNDKNSSKNIPLIRNNSAKDGLTLTSLIASNPLSLTSSESSTSDTLSLTSSNSSTSDTGSGSLLESSISDNLSLTSLESNDMINMIDMNDINDMNEMNNMNDMNDINDMNEMNNIENLLEEPYTSLDSTTYLNSESFER